VPFFSKAFKWILAVLVLTAAGLIVCLQSMDDKETSGTMIYYHGDPLGQLGKSWSPEQLRQIHDRGKSQFKLNEHISRTIRLDELDDIKTIVPGKIDNAGSRPVDISRGVVQYLSNCSAWGTNVPCVMWRFDGLDINKDRNFGGIEVQINDRRSGEHSFQISFLSKTATVPLVPQQTMKYIILPDMTSHLNKGGVFNRDSLVLVFPDVEQKDDLNLVSITILSKISAYKDASSGKTHEVLNQETRPVFYQWTDGEVAFSVDLPGRKPMLKFGNGLLSNSQPITFSVIVESKGNKKEVFNKKLSIDDSWIDNSIDLSVWRKSGVRIIFRAKSQSATVALWSSPRIVEAGSRGKFFCVYLVDALRPDFCEGFSTLRTRRINTPAIRSLAEGGALMNNALANAPLTKYSMPALFSGLYPYHTGVMTYQRVPDNIETLAETFRHRGFMTASFLLNGNAGTLRGLHQGFDYQFSLDRLSREARLLPKKNQEDIYMENPALNSAGAINEFLFDFLRTYQDEDTFLFIHLMDTHSPYFPDEEFLGGFNRLMTQKGLELPADRPALLQKLRVWARLLPKDRLPEDAMLELYTAAVQTADKRLGKFLDFLRAENMFERATIVFTADHGEHLNEHPEIGSFCHIPPMLLEVLRVPLIFYSPNIIPQGRTVSEPVQLADVMPTLLDLAGIPYDPAQFDGASLLPLMAGQENKFFENRPIVSQYNTLCSVFVDGIHSPDITSPDNVFIYNVEKDPKEHIPLSGKAAYKYLDLLVQSLAMIPVRNVPEVKTIINEQTTLEQLKQLGYIK
jgi:arylsulfatase A-like enzyme